MPRQAMVPIESIKLGQNPRQFFSGLEELANLLEEHGALVPLWLDTDHVIIAGERRYRACMIVHKRQPKLYAKLPCVIYDTDESYDLSVAENLGRQDFRFIEIARIFERYKEQGLTHKQIATKTAYREETIGSYLKIIRQLHPDIIKKLDNGEDIAVNKLIQLHVIKPSEVQLIRYEQWLGTPTAPGEAKPSKERQSGLSRKKLLRLVKVLQESGASDETMQVIQYAAGLRTTLPHKWHLKLSPKRQPRPMESFE